MKKHTRVGYYQPYDAQRTRQYYVKNQDKLKQQSRQWNHDNRERKSKTSKKYYRNNLEKCRNQNHERYERNKDRIKARAKQWRQDNADRVKANLAKRRAQKLNATPKWANFDGIQQFYTIAQHLTQTTGVRHTVDHIVPLVHPNVCGLHCEHNLQVITHKENNKKRNKLIDALIYDVYPKFEGVD